MTKTILYFILLLTTPVVYSQNATSTIPQRKMQLNFHLTVDGLNFDFLGQGELLLSEDNAVEGNITYSILKVDYVITAGK